jgi:hypothetical protein
MVLNKSAVKKLFNRDGVQVNVLALNYIDEWAYKAVLDMIENQHNTISVEQFFNCTFVQNHYISPNCSP